MEGTFKGHPAEGSEIKRSGSLQVAHLLPQLSREGQAPSPHVPAALAPLLKEIPAGPAELSAQQQPQKSQDLLSEEREKRGCEGRNPERGGRGRSVAERRFRDCQQEPISAVSGVQNCSQTRVSFQRMPSSQSWRSARQLFSGHWQVGIVVFPA